MKEKFKNKILKCFIVFLVVMLALTFISRMIYAEKLPRVTLTNVKQQSIVHNISGSGTVEAMKKNPVFIPSGLRVNEVMVKDGDIVESGDILLKLDMDYLNEKIISCESEISSELNSQQGGFINITKHPIFTESELRVNEVYVMPGDTVSNGQALIKLDMNYLIVKMNALENEIDSDCRNRDGCYEREDYTAADALSASMNIKYDQLARYESIYNRDGIINSDIDGVVTNVNVCPGDTTTDTAVVLLSNDPRYNGTMDLKRNQLEILKAIVAEKGAIASDTTGVVTDLNIKSGDITSDTSVLNIADTSSGMYFSSQISEALVKYISIGDHITINFRNGKLRADNCEVTNIKKSQSEKDYLVEVSLDNDNVQIGEIGEFKSSVLSDTKYYCFPSTSVHFDTDSKTEGYVYIINETEGFIDMEYEVHKMNIAINDSNDSYYGTSQLDIIGDEKFVLSSTKELSEGQKVRVS